MSVLRRFVQIGRFQFLNSSFMSIGSCTCFQQYNYSRNVCSRYPLIEGTPYSMIRNRQSSIICRSYRKTPVRFDSDSDNSDEGIKTSGSDETSSVWQNKEEKVPIPIPFSIWLHKVKEFVLEKLKDYDLPKIKKSLDVIFDENNGLSKILEETTRKICSSIHSHFQFPEDKGESGILYFAKTMKAMGISVSVFLFLLLCIISFLLVLIETASAQRKLLHHLRLLEYYFCPLFMFNLPYFGTFGSSESLEGIEEEYKEFVKVGIGLMVYLEKCMGMTNGYGSLYDKAVKKKKNNEEEDKKEEDNQEAVLEQVVEEKKQTPSSSKNKRPTTYSIKKKIEMRSHIYDVLEKRFEDSEKVDRSYYLWRSAKESTKKIMRFSKFPLLSKKQISKFWNYCYIPYLSSLSGKTRDGMMDYPIRIHYLRDRCKTMEKMIDINFKYNRKDGQNDQLEEEILEKISNFSKTASETVQLIQKVNELRYYKIRRFLMRLIDLMSKVRAAGSEIVKEELKSRL